MVETCSVGPRMATRRGSVHRPPEPSTTSGGKTWRLFRRTVVKYEEERREYDAPHSPAFSFPPPRTPVVISNISARRMLGAASR